MADPSQHWQKYCKPSERGSYMDMDVQVKSQLTELNPIMWENFDIKDLQAETFLAHQPPEFPASDARILPYTSQVDYVNVVQVPGGMVFTSDDCHESMKEKVMESSKSNTRSISSTEMRNQLKVNDDIKKKNSLGKGMKRRTNETEVEKSEVIHVRARRGQATDSHSLAERARREKINSRWRRLQDLVPGCYKTMGMAIMLDEIINYIHSLQNQVELLSRELALANSLYHFNLETDVIRTSAGIDTNETQEKANMVREVYSGKNFFLSA